MGKYTELVQRLRDARDADTKAQREFDEALYAFDADAIPEEGVDKAEKVADAVFQAYLRVEDEVIAVLEQMLPGTGRHVLQGMIEDRFDRVVELLEQWKGE